MIAVCIVQVVVLHFFHTEVMEGKVKRVIGNHLVVDFTNAAKKIKDIEPEEWNNYVVTKDKCEVIK